MVQGFSSSSNSTNPHSEFVQEGQQGTCLCVFLMLHYNSSHTNFSQTIAIVHTQISEQVSSDETYQPNPWVYFWNNIPRGIRNKLLSLVHWQSSEKTFSDIQCFKTSRANFSSKFQNRLALNWLNQISNKNYLTFYTLCCCVLNNFYLKFGSANFEVACSEIWVY